MPHRKLIEKSFVYIFYLLLIVFLAVYLGSIDFSQFASLSINYGYLLVACVLALSFRYWGAFIWLSLLRLLGAKNASFSRPLVYIYAKAWLGRYIPGTAPWILGKIYFAAKQGISKNKLAVSSLLEAALQIIVQMLFALALLALDPRLSVIPNSAKALIVIILIIGLVVLIPRVFNKALSIVYKFAKKKVFSSEHHVTGKILFRGVELYTAGTVLSSLSLFFIAKAVYPDLGYDQILFVMGVGTLSGAISMLAVFAPGGIGVREGIQLVLLSLIMPTEIALIITVVTRLWSVAVDLLFFAISRSLLIRKR